MAIDFAENFDQIFAFPESNWLYDALIRVYWDGLFGECISALLEMNECDTMSNINQDKIRDGADWFSGRQNTGSMRESFFFVQ